MIKSESFLHYRRMTSCTLLQKHSWNFIDNHRLQHRRKRNKFGRSDSKILRCVELIPVPVQMVQLAKPPQQIWKLSACLTCFLSCLTPSEVWSCHVTPWAGSHSCVCCLRPSPNNFLKLCGISLKRFQNHISL